MKASELLASFPSVDDGKGGMRHPNCPERETLILAAFIEGHAMPIRWTEVHTIHGEHQGVLLVAEDALGIGEGDDWVRPAVSCATAQAIADHFGCLLPTALVSDLAWQQAKVRLVPHPQPADLRMADAERFYLHHARVEQERAGRPGLVSTVGKDWILSPRALAWPGWGVNYGWQSGPMGRPIQELGPKLTRPFHNVQHTDYSQVAPRLVQPTMLVGGEPRDVAEVLADPELCGLVSNEGPIDPAHYPEAP